MKEKKCNCESKHTCKQQEEKKYTYSDNECTCGCEDNCECDENCTCGCQDNKTTKSNSNKK